VLICILVAARAMLPQAIHILVQLPLNHRVALGPATYAAGLTGARSGNAAGLLACLFLFLFILSFFLVSFCLLACMR
jgi:hypothetical protein